MSGPKPLIRFGKASPEAGGCIMQWAVWTLTDGTRWSDEHPCFNAAVTAAAQCVNDGLTDDGRARLARDFPSRIDRCRAAVDPKVEERVMRRMGEWAGEVAESVRPTWRQFICRYLEDGEIAPAVSAACFAYAAPTPATTKTDDLLLDILDRLIDQWEKIAADEGALGDLWEWADYVQAGGS